MSEVENLERQLEQCKKQKERQEITERLLRNPDFRLLFVEGFCRDDAARLVQESCDPVMDPAQRADCLSMAQASGHVKRFLTIQIQMGEIASRNISQLETAIAEARAEEGAL